jgi:spermidine/putrescine-binding protein
VTFKTMTAAALVMAALAAPAAAQQYTGTTPSGRQVQVTLPTKGSAAWLDSMCMSAHANSGDIADWTAALCHANLTGIWNTAAATAKITGSKPLICTNTPIAAEQMELVYRDYSQKHFRDPAYEAPYSAEPWALAAFMAAYPCSPETAAK